MTSIFKPPPITTVQRQALVLESGELVFDTDQQAAYWGDGATLGGKQGLVSAFDFNQAAALTQWDITHNLGRNPAVTIIDTVDDEVEGRIVYNTINDLTLIFTSPIAGNAYLT